MALDRIRDVSLKLLCSHGGCMQYSTLRRELCQVLQVTDSELCRMLKASQCFTIVPGQGSKRAGSQLSEDTQLIATASVRLCKDFLKKSCRGSCSQIHLCKFFLLGNCKFSKGRNICNFSHAIHSPHNLSVLSSIAKLTEAELRQLLLQNDTSLLPEICTFYNKGPGRYGSCTYKQECTKLHVCLHYVQGSCKFGSSCKRCHSFSDSNSAMTLENLRADVAHNLLQTYQNLYSIKNYTPHDGKATEKSPRSRQSSGSSSGDVDSEEICLYFVRKNCSFKDQCNRVHFKLPYRWQIHGESWQDLLNMEQIEKDYCNPSKTRSSVINFDAMISGLSQIRRLSTASSVTKPPHYILTTEWLWYWKDEYGKWIEYGKQEGLHSAASTTSINLEKAYLADSNGKVEFTAGKHQYVLSFKEMCQTNVHIGTQRAVRRRPKFISEKDLENQIQNQGKPGQSGSTRGKSIPANWDKSLDVDIEYKLVRVLESSEEYKQVQTLFQRTMRNSVIQKIERVQNLALWEVFQWQKEQMTKASGGADVVEKQLFHGTDPKFIEAICQQNFDWRICGVHGTAYGRGTYFARDASYSHNYCQPRQGAMTMFVARVLVGQFVKGDSSYLRPPLRDGSKSSYYDSCVNDVSNPSIFVIFEKHQIYPEYVIDYKS